MISESRADKKTWVYYMTETQSKSESGILFEVVGHRASDAQSSPSALTDMLMRVLVHTAILHPFRCAIPLSLDHCPLDIIAP